MANGYSREQRYWFIEVAKSFLNMPYIWAGDDFVGFDCSGMTVEALISSGKLLPKTDLSAEGLWQKFGQLYRVVNPTAGCMAFWFTNGKATHVAICVSEFFCITADGGGSKTLTVEDAKKQNAFIKIRPINHRATAPQYVDVFKE